MADAFADNLGALQISPEWVTSYYRNYRSAYVQDDWKFNSKLTVNLGVRYDFIQPDSSKPGDLANLIIASQGLNSGGAVGGNYASGVGSFVLPAMVANSAPLSPGFVSLLASQNVTVDYTNANQNSLASVQHYNFAPRIGLAYQYDPKTVVRAGYGLFYGAIEAPGGAELENNYPFNYKAVLVNNYESYHCYPSTETGYTNINSRCPSNGTPDLLASNPANPTAPNPSPGYSVLPGGAAFPFATTLETGASAYFATGNLTDFASGVATNLAMGQTNIKTPYTQSYNLTVEREINRNLVATLAYVGNNSKHTFAGIGPLNSLGITSNNDPNIAIAFPSLGTDSATEWWIGESMYNGLQAKLENRYSQGLSFLATYTWAKATDDAGNPGVGGGPAYRNTNLIPLKDEFTLANYDTRQRVTVNGMYELPFGKGRKYAHEGSALDYLVGGWSNSLTWVAQTGIPFTVNASSGAGGFQSANGFSSLNAIKVGDPFKGGGTVPVGNLESGACPTSVKNKTNWYNPCAFIDPLQGSTITPGTVLTSLADAIAYSGSKSNQIHGPGYERINMSMFKNFKTWREQYVQFRADAFNLFNHPTLALPGTVNLSSSAGQITSALVFQNNTPDARFFQLSGKYVF
jgi:hypothetical protein